MPPPLPLDDDSDVDELPTQTKSHKESHLEADVHAKDQLKDELMDDIEAHEGTEAAQIERERISPTASVEGNDDVGGTDEEDNEEPEEAYEVEAIIDHEWKRKPGKGRQPLVLLYNVKWKGYPSSDNTLEPEANLLTSRDLLAKYHHKIGGAPPPPTSGVKAKRSSKNIAEDGAASGTDDSPAPPASKRQKTKKQEDGETTDADIDADETLFGSWVPKGNNWESDITTIQTVERDQATNDLYILLLFKNGKKSRVKNNVMRKKAPQKLLDFYEAHLSV